MLLLIYILGEMKVYNVDGESLFITFHCKKEASEGGPAATVISGYSSESLQVQRPKHPTSPLDTKAAL